MAKLSVGDEVRIRFWDHREGSDHVKEYFVYGRVQRLAPRSVTVDCWANIGTEDEDRDDGNVKTYTILRRCITEIWSAHWSTIKGVGKRKAADGQGPQEA